MLVCCDNQAVVSMVNLGYSKDKDMMHLMRCLFLSGYTEGLELEGGHIPGVENVVADASLILTSVYSSRQYWRPSHDQTQFVWPSSSSW